MFVTLFLFSVGILLGAAAEVAVGALKTTSVLPAQEAEPSAAPAKQYPSLSSVSEPPVAAKVADALRGDDAVTLATLVQTQDSLRRLRASVSPIVVVSDIQFTGATQSTNGEIVSAYLVRGRDRSGLKFIRGFAINVLHDEVIGVNY